MTNIHCPLLYLIHLRNYTYPCIKPQKSLSYHPLILISQFEALPTFKYQSVNIRFHPCIELISIQWLWLGLWCCRSIIGVVCSWREIWRVWVACVFNYPFIIEVNYFLSLINGIWISWVGKISYIEFWQGLKMSIKSIY